MSKQNGNNKVRLSVKALAGLELLADAKGREEPFQELDLTKQVLRGLMQKNLITESPGIDGTVKYSITGRGLVLLKSGNYYTFYPAIRGNGRQRDCESCEHRQLLEMVKGRVPAVRVLVEKREELDTMKDALRAGESDDTEIIREMYEVVTEIDALMARLEAYSEVRS